MLNQFYVIFFHHTYKWSKYDTGMHVKAKVGPRFQVVIPKEIREILGIKRGEIVVFEVREGELVLKRYRGRGSVEELFNIVPDNRKLKKRVDVKGLILSEAIDRWSIWTQTSSSKR